MFEKNIIRRIGTILAAGSLLCILVCALHSIFRMGQDISYRTSGKREPIRTPIRMESEGIVNVNRAELTELTQLPGIGKVTAQAIMAEKQINGPFFYPEDLLAVKGIGPGKLNQIRSMLMWTDEGREE